MKERVLVLNQNYEPLNVCSWQRAVTLMFMDKAVAVAHNSKVLRSPSTEIRMPTVVRLTYQIKRPLRPVKISRSSIMARDNNRCQYCGRKSKNLTLDHVIPKDRGGDHSWENVVACCTKCNNEKGNRTPKEAGMKLRKKPRRPRFIPFLSYSTFRSALKREDWRDYLEPFAPHLLGD